MTQSVMQILEAAVAQHQAGRLAEAERLYRAVLQQAPQQPDALNLLGIIAAQQGDLNQAISLFDQAIAAAPQLATVPFNKANTLRDAGRSEEARAAYEAALDVDPNFHDTRLNLGVLLQQNDDTEDALRHFNILARLDPKSHPIAQKVHYNIGKCRHSQGRLEEAATALEKALALNPNDPDAHFAIANVHADLRDHQKAVTHINAAIKLKPDWPEAYSVLGLMLSRSEQFEAAIAAGKKAAELDPKSGSIHLNLALVCNAAGETAEAEAALEQALESTDANTEAMITLATMAKDNLDPWGALNLLEHALKKSASAITLNNIGAMFRDLDLNMLALTFYETAAQEYPQEIEAVRSLGYLNLRLGDLKDGWHINHARLDDDQFRRLRQSTPPFWRGEDISSKKLHIFLEEGIGDQVLQTSLISEMTDRAGSCTLECASRLVPVLKRSFPTTQVIDDQDSTAVQNALSTADFQCPALELGYHLRNSFENFPVTRRSFLSPDRSISAAFKKKYEALAKGRKIVGITWSSQSSGYGHYKTVDLDSLKPVLGTDATFYVSLQYGDVASNVEAFRKETGISIYVDDEVDQLNDLENFFAQVAAMDLVVTISNTTAHISGALGIPTWVMLPRGAGALWYWFLDRADSPWYPSVRLFRQSSIPELDRPWWPEVIEQVAAALPEWLSQSENTPQSSSEPS